MNLIHRHIRNFRDITVAKGVYAVLGILFFALSAVSCVNEDLSAPVDDSDIAHTIDYYISFNITTPSQSTTRSNDNSYTQEGGNSNHGELAGTTEESTLYFANVYLCVDNDVKYELETTSLTRGSEDNYKLVAKIESIYDLKALAGKEIQILMVGNAYNTELDHNLKATPGNGETNDASKATFIIDDIESRPLGKFGVSGLKMPLMNSKNFTFSFTKGATDAETVENILKLFKTAKGNDLYYEVSDPLELERGVARIEYKDIDRAQSSEEETTEPDEPEQVDEEGSEGETAKSIEDLLKESYTYRVRSTDDLVIKMESMQIFNVNPESYLFRHFAEGTKSSATGAVSIFGNENGYSSGDNYKWVPTPDWTATENESSDGDATKTYTYEKDVIDETSQESKLLNPLSYNETSGYSVTTTNSLSSGIITMTDFEKHGKPADDEYTPWCYVTENTIPSTALMQEFDDDEENPEAILAQYATGVAFKFAILDKKGNPMKTSTPDDDRPSCISASSTEGAAPNTITIRDKQGQWVDVVPDVKGNYYLVYHAFIKHNDPTDGIDPMEYAVVRNNTYQLSILSISNLPFPNKPQNYYLSLDIKVLAWAKRDIHVTF